MIKIDSLTNYTINRDRYNNTQNLSKTANFNQNNQISQ